MKKVFISLLAVGAMLTMGCSGNGAENNDTTNVEATAAEQQYAFELTEQGVDPILLGMDVKSIPDAVDGLYDSKTEFKDWEEFLEYYIITFTNGGDTVMQAWGYDANYDKVFNIASIVVRKGANVKMQIADGENSAYVQDESLMPERPE